MEVKNVHPKVVLILPGKDNRIGPPSSAMPMTWLMTVQCFLWCRNSQEYFDAPKVLPRSRNASDDEDSAKALSASASLSVLLIPSLKEVSTQYKLRLHVIIVQKAPGIG